MLSRFGEDWISHRSLGFQSGLPHFAQPEFSVVRQHEEFVWLHDTYVENEEYAGLIVRRGWAGWEVGSMAEDRRL